MARKNRIKDILFWIVVLMLAYLIKSFIYYFPDIKQIVERYNYDLTIEEFEVAKIKNIDKSVKDKNGAEIFFIGRVSCPDCREVIRRIKTLEENLNLDLKYVDLEEKIEEEELDYLQEDLGVESIPSIIVISNEKIKKFDYHDIIETNYEKKIKGEICATN